MSGSELYTGHDPFTGHDGTDVLLWVHEDGTYEVALRPGRQWRGTSWGPPVELAEVEQ